MRFSYIFTGLWVLAGSNINTASAQVSEKVGVIGQIKCVTTDTSKDLCLDQDTFGVGQYNIYCRTCKNALENQNFYYDDHSRIRVLKNDRCLERESGGNIKAKECGDDYSQKWYLDNNGRLKIEASENVGECLDRNWMNDNVYLNAKCHRGDSQKFVFPDGFFGSVGMDHDGMPCPDTIPANDAPCYFSGQCGYGTETCDGVTYDSVIAICSNGGFGLVNTHACLEENPNNINADPTSYGDPHIKTWTGQKFDFHGGCDLVLIENPSFANGLGLQVHIRTEIHTWWSFIKTAAVRLGDHTLEVSGGEKQASYWLDGVEVAEMETGLAALGGDFPIHFTRITDHQGRARIDLGHDGTALSIETYKRYVRVSIHSPAAHKFDGSYGLLGSYPGGQKVARDKLTIMEDANEFGQEWQVLSTEPKLFHEESAVQHPMKCPMPNQNEKIQARRLGEAMITEEAAAMACARASEGDRDACIFDVMATNDKDIAGSY